MEAAAPRSLRSSPDALVKDYLPARTESCCFGCLSNTRLQNVFQKGSDGRDYSQIAFVITQEKNCL